MEGEAALRVLSYAVVEKADVYVAIVDALMAAKERFQIQDWGNVQLLYPQRVPRCRC